MTNFEQTTGEETPDQPDTRVGGIESALAKLGLGFESDDLPNFYD